MHIFCEIRELPKLTARSIPIFWIGALDPTFQRHGHRRIPTAFQSSHVVGKQTHMPYHIEAYLSRLEWLTALMDSVSF